MSVDAADMISVLTWWDGGEPAEHIGVADASGTMVISRRSWFYIAVPAIGRARRAARWRNHPDQAPRPHPPVKSNRRRTRRSS